MKEQDAVKLSSEIQKLLLENGQWVNIIYEMHPTLKMIRIESSIKIDNK